MSRIVKVTEDNLSKLIKKVMREQMDVSSDSEHYKRRRREVTIPFNELSMLGHFATAFCRDKEGFPDCKEVRDIFYKHNLNM
jgi:hypothetical protein